MAILKKGYEDESRLEGPLRGKQLHMCKERNILRGWRRTKNAHSSHRPLEMECYQTGDYAPPLIVTQTYTEEEEEDEQQQQTDRQRWTRHRCDNTYILTSGKHCSAKVNDYKRKQSLNAQPKNTEMYVRPH